MENNNPIRRFFVFALSALVLLYAAGVTLPLIWDWIFGESWRVIALYNTFVFWLWLPAPFLLVGTLILRRWILVAALIPITLVLLVNYGGRVVPPPTGDDPGPDMRVSVLTYNIQWRESTFAETIALIREADADVVALQEVSIEAADLITRGLDDMYPYVAMHPQAWGTNGMGLLSRYPIEASDYWQPTGSFGNQRAILNLATENNRTIELAVYNVHPVHPGVNDRLFDPTLRGVGIRDILAVAAEDDYQYRILLGDFNTSDRGEDYQALTDAYRDAFTERGRGLGMTYQYTAWSPPILRLDYVFTRFPVLPIRAEVMDDDGGSDHRPVWAELEILLDPTGSYF